MERALTAAFFAQRPQALPLYETLNTIKIDVSGFSPRETAGEILRVTEEL